MSAIIGGSSAPTFAQVNAALATADADISVNNQKITNLATPSASAGGANKGYADGLLVPGGDFAYLGPRMAAATNAGPVRQSPGSSKTHGISFWVTKSMSCTGAEGYWVHSGTESVRYELWSPAGASLANVSVSTSSDGKLTATWSSPVTLTPYQLYHVTQCVSGSNAVTSYTTGSTGITEPTAPFNAGNGLFIQNVARENSTANTFPNATGAVKYPVAPIFAAS